MDVYRICKDDGLTILLGGVETNAQSSASNAPIASFEVDQEPSAILWTQMEAK